MQQIKSALDENGFGDFMRNPKGLAEFLSNYVKVKAAFDEFPLLTCSVLILVFPALEGGCTSHRS